MEGRWWAKGKREMKPLLLRLGVALALSLAGYVYSHLRSHQRRPPSGSQPPCSSSGADAKFTGSRAGGGGLKDELQLMEQEDISPKVVNSPTAAVGQSSRDFGDKDEYPLPEISDLLHKEFESNGIDQDTSIAHTPKKSETEYGDAIEQEIATLRNTVSSLRDRERILEMQLLEYYGIKEQENTVRELVNRLKINTVEAKLLSLKFETLQADNRRLEAQVSGYGRIKAELGSAKGKIKLLKRKLKSVSEQAKERLASLEQRVTTLQDREDSAENKDAESNLKRMKDLEDGALDLRKVNSRMALEKLDLEKKLESILASHVLESPEAAKALEEANRLRETNEQLMKEIERLQTDRFTDAEELVYLGWVNACLRYELRNYQPPPGKTIARDLSKSLSPKSEEKAKQLILEYANLGIDGENISLADFSSECCSPSQTSSHTETGEDDTTANTPTARNSSARKTKFLSKFKKLVLGKETQINRGGSSFENSRIRASISSIDDVMDRDSYDSAASCITTDHVPGNQSMQLESKADEPRIKVSPTWRMDSLQLRSQSREVLKGERSRSCIGTPHTRKNTIFEEESFIGSPHTGQFDHLNADSPEKMELIKFANVLKSSRPKLKCRRRAASFDLY